MFDPQPWTDRIEAAITEAFPNVTFGEHDGSEPLDSQYFAFWAGGNDREYESMLADLKAVDARALRIATGLSFFLTDVARRHPEPLRARWDGVGVCRSEIDLSVYIRGMIYVHPAPKHAAIA
jgi:hypothetical protein